MNKMLTFKVKREGVKQMVAPRWVNCEVENADCPQCRQKMVVVVMVRRGIYAYCGKCDQYYIGE